MESEERAAAAGEHDARRGSPRSQAVNAKNAPLSPWFFLPFASLWIALGPVPASESSGPLQMALGTILERTPEPPVDLGTWILGLPFDCLLRRGFFWVNATLVAAAFAAARASGRLFGHLAALSTGTITLLALSAWAMPLEPWSALTQLALVTLIVLAWGTLLPIGDAWHRRQRALQVALYCGLASLLNWPVALATLIAAASVVLGERTARKLLAPRAAPSSSDFHRRREIASTSRFFAPIAAITRNVAIPRTLATIPIVATTWMRHALRAWDWPGLAMAGAVAGPLFWVGAWLAGERESVTWPLALTSWRDLQWQASWEALTQASVPLPASLTMIALGLGVVLLLPLLHRQSWPLQVILALTALAVVSSGAPTANHPGTPLLIAWLSIILGSAVWLATQLGVSPAIRHFLAGATCVALTLPSFAQALGQHTWPLGFVPEHAQAQQLPVHTLFRLQEHGLMLPGDVLAVHDPETFAEWHSTQVVEGIRPDLMILSPSTLEGREGAAMTVGWMKQGRRILSDSFSLGGRWNPAWAIDGGPFFWFLFSAAPREQQPVVDLLHLAQGANLSEREHLRWLRMHLERARFRRLATLETDALDALPISERRRESLQSALQMAHALRITTGGLTELGPTPPDLAQEKTEPAGSAAALAEAGDLLVSAGDFGLGSQLLREAGQGGYRPAISALARWQLMAGMNQDAQATLATLTSRYDLRKQALVVLQWLIDHQRYGEAIALRQQLHTPSNLPEDEVAVRLRLLSAMGQAPAAEHP